MPKVASKSSKHTKKFWVLTTFVVLLGLAVLGVGIWHYENNRAIAADRARFIQADKDVKTVAAAIRTALPPEKENISEECTHQSRDWQTEPIVCQTIYESFYGAQDLSRINEVVSAIQDTFKSNSLLFLYRSMQREGNKNIKQNESMISLGLPRQGDVSTVGIAYENRTSGLTCGLSQEVYNSVSPPSGEEYIPLPSSLVLLNTLVCGGQAKAAHFPLMD